MKPRDFSRYSSFPGTNSSRYGFVVRAADRVNQLPRPIFGALLVALALIPTWGDWLSALLLVLVFALDWALMAFLPRANKSFGPAQSPTMMLALFRSVFAFSPFPFNWLAQLIGTALVIYGFWIEPHRLTLTRQHLHSPKLNAAPPLRILHFGDLHVERVTDRERKLIDLCKSLAPDLILFSGDFLVYSSAHDGAVREHARSVLGELRAPLGTYVVTGSPPVDKPHLVESLLDGLNIRWLKDEKVTVTHYGEPIDIIGVSCTHMPHVDAPRLRSTVNGSHGRFTILLYHTPDLAPEAALAGIDLQLSGHTHGGQVRLPFFGALYTASLYGKRFEMGRHSIGDFTLYVTRGIGMEGKGAPRVRFLCPPEVVLWEIAGK